jgi:hypothetical protein
MRIDPDHGQVRILPVQVVDDGDVATAVAAGGQQAARPLLVEDRLRRTELFEDRGPAIDPALRFAFAGIRNLHQRPIPATHLGRSLRAAAQILRTP